MNDIVFVGECSDVGEHRHKGCEIICASSDGSMISAGVEYFYKEGDVIIIPRQAMHANAAGELCVRMENTLLPINCACVISGEGAGDIRWACMRARACFLKDMPKKQVVLDGLGGLLRALIAAYCGGNDYSPAVKGVLAEIERGLSDVTFSLENYMRGLPLNYDYVRKLFKKEVGLTPLEYLTAARMSRAREIMLSGMTNRFSKYTVSQIAEMCGFAEPLYFSRVFKKYYGLSPTEYIEKNK